MKSEYWDEQLEYLLLAFPSSTVVEGWIKIVDDEEQKDWTGTFIISDDQIFISFDGHSLTGTIDNEKITSVIDGETFVF